MQRNHRYTYTTKRDELFMRERNYNLHQQKLHDIKNFKSTPHHNPMIQTHKLKQIATKFAKEEQEQIIKKNNNHLFEKLTNISTRPVNEDYYNIDVDYHVFSNYSYRKELQNEINQQNKKLAQRILQQSSSVKFSEYDSEYEEIKKIKKRLSRINDQQSYLQKLRNKSSESQKKRQGIKLQPLNQSRYNIDNHNFNQNRQADISSYSSQDHQTCDNIYLTAVKEEDQEESIQRKQIYQSHQLQDSNLQKNFINTESDQQQDQHDEAINEDEDGGYQEDNDFQNTNEPLNEEVDIDKVKNEEDSNQSRNDQEEETKDQLPQRSVEYENYDDDFEA